MGALIFGPKLGPPPPALTTAHFLDMLPFKHCYGATCTRAAAGNEAAADENVETARRIAHGRLSRGGGA